MPKAPSLLLAASICISGAISPAAAQTQAHQTQGTPQVQYVQTAAGTTYKDGVLTLKDAAPMTTFFSDRPERLAGQVRNDHFAKRWSEGKNSFSSDPPNALLSVSKPQGSPAQAVLELSNPRIEGSNISYNVRTVRGDIPAEGAEATLFIDGDDVPCYSTDDPTYSSYPCWAQNAFSWGR